MQLVEEFLKLRDRNALATALRLIGSIALGLALPVGAFAALRLIVSFQVWALISHVK